MMYHAVKFKILTLVSDFTVPVHFLGLVKVRFQLHCFNL